MIAKGHGLRRECSGWRRNWALVFANSNGYVMIDSAPPATVPETIDMASGTFDLEKSDSDSVAKGKIQDSSEKSSVASLVGGKIGF